MVEIKIKFSNEKARIATYYLRNLYFKSDKVQLKTLCEIAIKKEITKQANKELQAIELQKIKQGKRGWWDER